MLETERKRIEQLTAGWEDPTRVDWGAQAEDGTPQAETPGDGDEKTPTYKCTAVYSYTVNFIVRFDLVFTSCNNMKEQYKQEKKFDF